MRLTCKGKASSVQACARLFRRKACPTPEEQRARASARRGGPDPAAWQPDPARASSGAMLRHASNPPPPCNGVYSASSSARVAPSALPRTWPGSCLRGRFKGGSTWAAAAAPPRNVRCRRLRKLPKACSGARGPSPEDAERLRAASGKCRALGGSPGKATALPGGRLAGRRRPCAAEGARPRSEGNGVRRSPSPPTPFPPSARQAAPSFVRLGHITRPHGGGRALLTSRGQPRPLLQGGERLCSKVPPPSTPQDPCPGWAACGGRLLCPLAPPSLCTPWLSCQCISFPPSFAPRPLLSLLGCPPTSKPPFFCTSHPHVAPPH